MQPFLSIAALLASHFILCLGHGLQSTLLPVRATLEDYGETAIGLMMSGYFLGFILGSFTGAHVIARVGHSRTFGAVAALAAVTVLLHALLVHPVTWVLLRFLYGFALVHVFMVTESWLNAVSGSRIRGRVLSIYMMLNFMGLIGGQWMMFLGDAIGNELFMVVAISITLALVPLLLSTAAQPSHQSAITPFGIRDLYRTSPLGIVGMLLVGLTGGAFWGLAAAYAIRLGYTPSQAALFVSFSFAGGLLAQMPLGILSDRFGRRAVVVLASGMVLTASAGLLLISSSSGHFWTLMLLGMLFGAGFHPTYSLFIAHANDFLEPQHFVRASAGLLAVYSVGAAIGPAIAGVAMSRLGPGTLFAYSALIMGALLAYTVHRLSIRRPIPAETTENFVPVPRTAAFAFDLDPRATPTGTEDAA